MAKVQVNNVVVLDNPSPFYNPFQFEITFECIEDLSEGLLPAIRRDMDDGQEEINFCDLHEFVEMSDSCAIASGVAQFQSRTQCEWGLVADAPNAGLIPDADAVGVTVVLITCTYRSQEFIRVGYYVNNEYTETELRENPPVKPDFSKKLDELDNSNPNLQSMLSTEGMPSASKGWPASENSLNVMLKSHMDCM
ncbi:hypothetical protein AB205_0022510 [Aquarana catesbeiana]|uniref:Uncharacterized protein n=1 Tax=Aquarana catesbeiana TaxID=8400 RepID=A0A2G9R841_AQUCT|nr:hypothetical protein AB205_0022510 [Aquarana catesbeiana]